MTANAQPSSETTSDSDSASASIENKADQEHHEMQMAPPDYATVVIENVNRHREASAQEETSLSRER